MKRECIAIKKGDRGWNHIVTIPKEFRHLDPKDIEDIMSVRDGRVYYDFRVDPETWALWLKKKDIPINYKTSRDE